MIAARQSPRRLADEARAFAIWRVGKPVAWDCTVSELAAATKVNQRTVRRLCLERGWPVSDDRPNYPPSRKGFPPSYMPDLAAAGLLHLVGAGIEE